MESTCFWIPLTFPPFNGLRSSPLRFLFQDIIDGGLALAMQLNFTTSFSAPGTLVASGVDVVITGRAKTQNQRNTMRRKFEIRLLFKGITYLEIVVLENSNSLWSKLEYS